MKLYGKDYTQHRSVGFYSDKGSGYKYSGQTTPVNQFHDFPNMKRLLSEVNGTFESEFNGILVNYYKDGEDRIARHADKYDVDPMHGVVAISWGSSRIFRVTKDKINVLDLRTTPGQIIHMTGEFQKHYQHEVPKEKKVKEPRYSFTFRKHKDV